MIYNSRRKNLDKSRLFILVCSVIGHFVVYLIKLRAKMSFAEVYVSSSFLNLFQLFEVNGYPHVSAVLLPVEERRVSTGEALEPV
jgi:hypothetical protein